MTIFAQNGLSQMLRLVVFIAILASAEIIATPDDDLLKRATTGDIAGVQRALAKKANPNAAERNGETALILAAQNGHARVVQLLIEAGADVNGPFFIRYSAPWGFDDGWTPLFIASKRGHIEVVKLLIQAKANVHARNLSGSTPLIWASTRTGNADIIKLLILSGADVNAKTKDGGTALMAAALIGDLEIVKLLIHAKADLNAKNKKNETAASLAATNNRQEIVKYLMDSGAK
ncbi:MAG: ankyrin repeat domain-containing protein [Leptospiraceae bacterium]|nr:ankyrin repeat domain-containing protein [Leptospiraceae bacterium]